MVRIKVFVKLSIQIAKNYTKFNGVFDMVGLPNGSYCRYYNQLKWLIYGA